MTVDPAWATTDVEVLVTVAGGRPRKLEGTRRSGVPDGTPARIPRMRGRRSQLHAATTTLPIRRLGLDIGEEAEIHVAWLVWPQLTVQRVLQRYTRLAEDRYRYRQDEFEAELTVDRQGLVLEYEGLWRAIAIT